MTKVPIVFRTTHWVTFSDLDPYQHVGTARYAAYFVDHRMQGLSQRIGWSVEAISRLPFAVWVRRLEIDYIRPVLGDQEIAISSFVRQFSGPDATIECTMTDASGRVVSRALMVAACVDRTTGRSMPWPDDAVHLFFEDPSP